MYTCMCAVVYIDTVYVCVGGGGGVGVGGWEGVREKWRGNCIDIDLSDLTDLLYMHNGMRDQRDPSFSQQPQ